MKGISKRTKLGQAHPELPFGSNELWSRPEGLVATGSPNRDRRPQIPKNFRLRQNPKPEQPATGWFWLLCENFAKIWTTGQQPWSLVTLVWPRILSSIFSNIEIVKFNLLSFLDTKCYYFEWPYLPQKIVRDLLYIVYIYIFFYNVSSNRGTYIDLGR